VIGEHLQGDIFDPAPVRPCSAEAGSQALDDRSSMAGGAHRATASSIAMSSACERSWEVCWKGFRYREMT